MPTPLSVVVTDDDALTARNTESVDASIACCVAMAKSIVQAQEDMQRTRHCIAESLRLISAVNSQLDTMWPHD